MCLIDDCDHDELEWLGASILTATNPDPLPGFPPAAPVTCGDCDRPIQRHEQYEAASWHDHEGERTVTFTLCAHCRAAARWLQEVCSGFVYGYVLEELGEHWDEDPSYRTVGLGRLVICGRNDWRRRGELIPVGTVRTWVDDALQHAPVFSAEGMTTDA